MRNLKETSIEGFGISSVERRENSSRVLYIYFTARFESNCASDLVSSSTILTAKTRGLGGSHRLGGDLVARVSRKESLETRGLKRSLLLQVGFFQMTTRDRRERGKFWPGFRATSTRIYVIVARENPRLDAELPASSSLGIHSTRLFFRASESVDIVSFLLCMHMQPGHQVVNLSLYSPLE